MRCLWLGLALIPYAGLAGYDGWLHERARKVPRVEQALHAALAVSLLAFLTGAFRARPMLALPALGVFLTALAWDEFGFHGHLDSHERRVHFAAFAMFCVFVTAWILVGIGP